MGPMFRYERPQKGRYRQFHQLDVEVFGMHDPAVDAEVIDLAWSLVEALGIPQAELVINSVGCAEVPAAVSGGAARRRSATTCRSSAATASGAPQTNPLRIYDCKVPADQPIIDRLPHSVDYLCEPCATHFAGVQAHLDDWDIPWRLSHRLVRGLDYYTRTTFEVLGQTLGAQNALLGGGRYDGLVKQLGGPDRTGIGFAAGLERLVLALPDGARRDDAAAGVRRRDRRRRPRRRRCSCCANCAARAWRRRWSSRRAACKAQMKRADRAGARASTLIVGGDELARGEVTLRDMRAQRAARHAARGRRSRRRARCWKERVDRE